MGKDLKTNRGTSIFEVTVFLLLGLLLLGASMPSLGALLKKSKLKREAERLESTMKSLAIKAVQNDSEIALELHATSYAAFFAAKPKRRFSTHELSHPVMITTPSRDTITFYKSGAVSPARIELKDGSTRCILRISLRGRVTKTC